MQTTLKRGVQIAGTGLHSGRPARLRLVPAVADHGIVFVRVDVADRDNAIAARFDNVTDTTLNTRLTNAAGVSISTVEHLMAALAGCGVHNLRVEIDGPEVPIMDGSSRRFVREILNAGVAHLDAPLRVWKVAKTVVYREGAVSAALMPHDGMEIDFEIDFDDPAIGRQKRQLDMANGSFARELSDCRTFCNRADVELMQASGLALGGTLENAVVVENGQVLNPEGFRRADECVRHKMLDALGDLMLADAPILGRYVGHRAGHGATNRLLRKAFETPGALVQVTCPEDKLALLPGYHIEPADLAAVG